MTIKLVFQFVVKERSHGAPHITGTNGKLGYLDGLGLAIINTGSVELVTHGTGTDCDDERRHQRNLDIFIDPNHIASVFYREYDH